MCPLATVLEHIDKVSASSVSSLSLAVLSKLLQKSLLATSPLVVSSMDISRSSRPLCGMVIVIEAEFILFKKLK